MNPATLIAFTICSAIMATTVYSLGQQQLEKSEDTQLWEGLTISVNASKKLECYFSGELRYHKNISELKSNISQIGFEYRMAKWLDMGAHYRLTNRATDIRHRIGTWVKFKWTLNPIRFNIRLQGERESTAGQTADTTVRARLRISLAGKRTIRPFAGGELFFISDDTINSREKSRLTVGADWKLKKKTSLKLFYHFQIIQDLFERESIHIFGFTLEYNL